MGDKRADLEKEYKNAKLLMDRRLKAYREARDKCDDLEAKLHDLRVATKVHALVGQPVLVGGKPYVLVKCNRTRAIVKRDDGKEFSAPLSAIYTAEEVQAGHVLNL